MGSNEIVKLIDELYLIVYLFILVIAGFLLYGVQDIVATHIPVWEGFYNLFQIFLIIFSVIGVYLNLSHNREEGWYFIIIFFVLFLVNAIVQLIVLFGFSIDYGIMFRTGFYIFFSIVLLYRVRLIRQYIKEGL